MFNATTFTYDGVYSGIYGLLIAEFNPETVQSSMTFTPTVRAVKSAKSNRFSFAGIVYEEMPEFSFSIISEHRIPDILRRELLSWLTGRAGFKRLQIHQPEYQEYEYNCIFSAVEIIYVNGHCHGFNVTAKFDSPYCYGRPRKRTVNGTGEEVAVKLVNESDIVDGYVYPIVKFTARDAVDGKAISIINEWDAARPFEFCGLTPHEEVMVDNELKIITSSVGGDKLSGFSKNWLRLRRGVNELRIRIDGTVTIECPTYVLIGF